MILKNSEWKMKSCNINTENQANLSTLVRSSKRGEKLEANSNLRQCSIYNINFETKSNYPFSS